MDRILNTRLPASTCTTTMDASLMIRQSAPSGLAWPSATAGGMPEISRHPTGKDITMTNQQRSDLSTLHALYRLLTRQDLMAVP